MAQTPLIYVINGPNLNLLGTREPEIYGTATLADVEAMLMAQAAERGVALRFLQSNHEGQLVEWLHDARTDGARAVLINAGAYTHTSIALLDAIKAISLPVIEVHLSDPMQREPFRHVSYVGMAAVACFAGHGIDSYRLALDAAVRL